jgi:hypothetical protein
MCIRVHSARKTAWASYKFPSAIKPFQFFVDFTERYLPFKFRQQIDPRLPQARRQIAGMPNPREPVLLRSVWATYPDWFERLRPSSVRPACLRGATEMSDMRPTAAYYRQMAAEVEQLAQQAQSAEVRRELQELAERFRRMAERREQANGEV